MYEVYKNFLEAFPWVELNRILDLGPQHIHFKSLSDIVTNVDLALEKCLVSFIQSHFPSSAIQSEEAHSEAPTLDRQMDYWLLDPLDGTHNYSYHMPYYGIQLCHVKNGSVCFAMIYLPALGEIFTYIEGRGAATYLYKAGEKALPQMPEVEPKLNPHSYYSFGDFSNSNQASRLIQGQLMTQLSSHVCKIRIHGASSVDFAFLCASRSQAHFVFSNRPWEIFPGTSLSMAYGKVYRTYDLDTAFYKGQLHVIGQSEELDFIEDILKL